MEYTFQFIYCTIKETGNAQLSYHTAGVRKIHFYKMSNSVMELIVTRYWVEQNHISSEKQNYFH